MEHLKCWIEVVVVMLVLLNGLGWSHGCVDQEREGLLQLKPFFKYLHWPAKAEENSSDCCEWEMVECNATTGRITKLSLFEGATETKLWYLNASYFSPFEQLTSLNLRYNQLVGCAENQGFEILWSRLRKLEVLDLGGNKFSDNIISSLSGFSSLKSLYLWGNGMGTTLDTKGFESLWRLSNLEQLDLGGNQFNNSILSSLHGLSSLKDLYLGENQLSGTINMQDLNNLVNLKNLDMSGNQITGFISFKELSGLRNLEDLQLNDNKIEEIVGPEDKTTLNKLKVLGLSRLQNNGKGIVLKSLGALSTLKTIYLGGNILNETNRFEELFNLSSLEELFLDDSTLHKDFLQNHVASLTSLKLLHLRRCNLKGTLPDRGWCDLRNLEDLDLTYNELEGALPPCMANLSSIRILHLSHNQFTGNIASISNLKSIESLSLQSNHFQVSLKLFANHSYLKAFLVDDGNEFIDEVASQPWTPKFQLEELSVSNFTLKNSNSNFLNFLYHQFELRYLYLYRVMFGGAFPNWLFENNARLERFYLVDNSFVGRFQWPSRPNPNMSVIDISHNKLVGHIPSNISFLFPNLRSLNLSENYFQGILPASLGELKLLESLDLSNNQFSGELQEHQFAQSSILLLKLSNNNFTGRIPTNLFHMIGLVVLQLDGNKFVGEIPDFSPLNDLRVLDMSHNSLSGNLPRWMANMSYLNTVFLSDNQFEGPIPSEFCKLYYLHFLDLSRNYLSGSIPPCFSELGNLEHLLLRRNKLSGRMTQSFLNMTSLITLDLGENNFIGTIPKWIGNLSNLGILILRGNEFQGDIPVHLCNLSRLNILDLSSNSLSGRLPSCLSHFSFTMGFNLSQNSQISWWYTGGQLNIMSSILKGVVEFTTKRNSYNYTGYILDHMYAIDLSYNRFSGGIPPEFGNLSNLRALNLSHNSLIGSIPTSFSKLKQLESLDLSYNALNGRIPPQLIEINALAVFSVAYNNLSGPLPDFKSQFGTFNNSSYEGNPLLCGPPLNNSCKKTHFASPPAYPFKEESENDGFMDMTFFWVTFVVTYTVALFGLALVLYINSSWRHAWFYYVEVCFNTCYYFVVDKFQ